MRGKFMIYGDILRKQWAIHKPKAVFSMLIVLCSPALEAAQFQLGNVFGELIGRSNVSGNNMNIDQALTRIAEKANKTLPANVDPETRLEKMSAEKDKQLVYHYTLIGKIAAAGLSSPAEFEKAMGPIIKKRLCTSEEMKIFVKNGVSFSYRYQSAGWERTAEVKVKPTECKDAKQ